MVYGLRNGVIGPKLAVYVNGIRNTTFGFAVAGKKVGLYQLRSY